MKRRILARHLHDEVQSAARLGTELQRSAGTDELNPFYCVEDRRVMCFRKTELLVLDRYAVLEHLHRLGALGIKTAITEVNDRRARLLADQQTGRGREHLPVVVVRDARE